MHQVMNMMKGEEDEKEEVIQRGDDECRGTKLERDLRRLEEKRRAQEEHEQRHEEEEKRENEEEDERVRVAPNMGAGGSHPQAMSDRRKEREEQEELDGQTVKTKEG